jgi:hypothetical protein
MTVRHPWQGLWTIVRLNWPLYGAALAGLLIGVVTFLAAASTALRGLAFLAVAGALYFVVGSLVVSHLIYDRSELYRWSWTGRALAGRTPAKIVCCHTGFDDFSESLKTRFAGRDWSVLDHYDAALMTEPSIRRARRLYPPAPGTLPTPYNRWPARAEGAEIIFAPLAIHELRGETERVAWFREALRCLGQGGRIVVVEHPRDLANFLAFGPGFLHFHSPATWRRSARAAGLRVVDEFRVTPWIRVFCMERS